MTDTNRWCDTCGQHHGPLYICEHYPVDLKQQIAAEGKQFERDLRDPKWISKQIENGATMEEIVIFRALCGF